MATGGDTVAEVVESQMPQWSEFVDLLKPAGELINDTFFPDSEQLRAQLYRQLVTPPQIERDLRALLGGFAARLSRRWIMYQNTILERGLVNTLEMTDFGGVVPVQWDHLPANARRITPAERAASLSARRIGAQLRRRW